MAWRNSSNVAAQIRRSVTDGTYRRHDRLPASRQLAESFGVARNTLRDALQQLEREGLLEIRPGSGAYVTGIGDQSIPRAVEEAAPLELIDARFALEPHICRLSVLHGRREDFDAMDDLCRRMESSTTDPTEFSEADTAFHMALASATRNNLLIWLIRQINTVRSLDEWTRMRQLTLNAAMIDQYNLQHRDILDALRSREPERAAAKMKEHLETARLSLTRAAET